MGNLKKKQFPAIDEVLYHNVLDNGLQVFLLPKKGFKERLAIMTSQFGSLDTKFTLDYEFAKNYPAGLAHFLEHKLFEREGQEDLALQFTNLGAESNAYTSFDKTTYFFSTTSHFQDNLKLLQSSLHQASFTEASIEKEKNIISQELNMYQDDADYRLYQGVLTNLYPNTSLAEDIAGTKDSLAKISYTDLQDNFTYFYHPSNRILFVSGDFDVKQVYRDIVNFQRAYPIRRSSRIERQELDLRALIKQDSIQMDVALPKLALGFRLPVLTGGSHLKRKIGLRIFFLLLFGWTSQLYQDWYADGKIDDSFDFEIEVSTYCQFVIITLDTKEPIAMASKIKRAIRNFSTNPSFTEEHFQIIKRDLYGDFLASLDSLDNLSSNFMTHLQGKETYLDYPSRLAELSLDQVNELARTFVQDMEVSEFTIFPR